MAVYYASKAYVLSFSEALHRELAEPRHPGHRALSGAGRRPNSRRAPACGCSASPKMLELPPDRVAEIGYAALMRGERVVIAGAGNRIAVPLMRLIPNALLLRAGDQRGR